MSNKPNLKARAAAPRPGDDRPRPVWASPVVWVLAVVGMALVVTIALAVSGDDDAPATNPAGETAFAEILDAPLPRLADPDPARGQTVPRISASTLDGERVTIPSGGGTARLYGFFAHWCSHCQAEVPVVAEWLNANELPAGVEVVAISTNVEESAPNYPPSAWFEREGWPTPVVVDDVGSPLAEGFGLPGFPYWVAADADGVVVARASTELGADGFAALISLIAPDGADAG